MHGIPLIQDLAVILATAGIVTLLFRAIRQPVVLGYVVAGILVGPHAFQHTLVQDLPNIQTWSELGVIFLMFALGLEFTFHKLTRVGAAAGGTALIEVPTMLVLGFLAGRFLGWTYLDSVFLGGILSISSTTIILKAFDEMGLKSKRFAETVLGVLIVEDLVAVLLLVGLSTVAVSQTVSGWELARAAGNLVLVVGTWVVVGYFLIPTFFRFVGRRLEDETLTIIACGLCLGLVVTATRAHYSSALGAFIMGSILAETREVHRIEHLIGPIKNVFGAVFFVSVGMLVDPQVILTSWREVALITVILMGGKMVAATAGALVSGQPVRQSVQTGFSLAQIGEFSFIIAALGKSLGVTSDFLYPIAVAVSAITTFLTPYLIRLSVPVAGWIEKHLPQWVRQGLYRYSLRLQLWKRVVKFCFPCAAATLVFLLVAQYGFLGDKPPALRWGVALLASTPFLWAMVVSFRPIRFVGLLAVTIWLAGVSDLFFPEEYALGGGMAVAIVLILATYRKMNASFRQFAKQFVETLAAGQAEELKRGPAWDVRLAKLNVAAHSALVGKTLESIDAPKKFQLNVLLIQRDRKNLVPPRGQDTLLPGDVLLVLGGDDAIEVFRKALTEEAADGHGEDTFAEYQLRRVVVGEQSPLLGKTIREARLPVVGLERGAERRFTPNPELKLLAQDVLWVFGR